MAMFERTTGNTEDERSKQSALARFQKAYTALGIGALLTQCNIVKPAGSILGVVAVGVSTIFLTLLLLVFRGKSLPEYLSSTYADGDGAKSTYYRFLTDPTYNWPKFIRLLALRVERICVSTISIYRPCFFVMDDSIIPRLTSQKAELLSYIYDHVRGASIKCFNLLLLGWTDGYSFLPVSLQMMHSKKLLKGIMDKIGDLNKRNSGYKLRIQSGMSKMNLAVEMVKQAIEAGFRANYLLVDTWFTNEPFVNAMRNIQMDVIGMLKDCKQQYWYRGKLYNLQGLRGLIHLDKGDRSGIWGSIIVETKYFHVPVKIVFAQNRNKRREYVLILSTDIDLSEEQIIQYYGNRWSIECCFKVCKGMFGLGKEFHGLTFDLLISSTAIVFTRYIILEYIHRISTDHRTLNWWVKQMYDEVPTMEFADALRSLLKLTVEAINKSETKFTAELRSKLVNWYVNQPAAVHAILPELDFKVYNGKADIPLPENSA